MGIAEFNFTAMRARARRQLRAVVLRTVNLGVAGAFAWAISAFDRRRGLYLRGRILGLAQRNATHFDFWKRAVSQYPKAPAFVRQCVHAALRAGQLADAEAGIAALIAARRTQAADSNFIIGLVYVYERVGDVSAIRALVRRYFRSLRGKRDYRIAALRLSGVVRAYFAHSGCDSTAQSHKRLRRPLMRMLERADLQPAPKALLERVLRAEEALIREDTPVLLDTDVCRKQVEAFVDLVDARLREAAPFSFVRVGDGEAACLPYEPSLASLAKGDAIERERIWWGKPLSPAQRARTTQLVFNATWSADCIGIPTVSRFLRELRLSDDDHLDGGLTGRGLRAILYSVEHCNAFRAAIAPPALFASCHLHQDLERWQLYPALLEGKRGVVLVSCHPELAEHVERRFGCTVAVNLIVPPDRVSEPALKGRAIDTERLPDVLDVVADDLREKCRGRLVLVGAGYLGKWLVDVARSEGGIALDVGSVFDYWLGFATRSYLDLHPVR